MRPSSLQNLRWFRVRTASHSVWCWGSIAGPAACAYTHQNGCLHARMNGYKCTPAYGLGRTMYGHVSRPTANAATMRKSIDTAGASLSASSPDTSPTNTRTHTRVLQCMNHVSHQRSCLDIHVFNVAIGISDLRHDHAPRKDDGPKTRVCNGQTATLHTFRCDFKRHPEVHDTNADPVSLQRTETKRSGHSPAVEGMS